MEIKKCKNHFKFKNIKKFESYLKEFFFESNFSKLKKIYFYNGKK